MTPPTRLPISRTGLVLWGVLLLAVAGTVLLLATRPRPEPPGPTPPRPVPVSVIEAAARDVPDQVELPVRLAPWSDALVAVARPGRVVELLAEEGDTVKASQPLMRVDDRTWRAAAQRARVQKREADREDRRWQELRGTGAVSESDYDAVRARRDIADAQLAEAEALLAQCTAASPVDGVVNRRLVELGEHAAEGAAVFQVLQTGRLRLQLDVPERDVYAVRTGEPLTFTLDALAGQVFTAAVHFVSAQADPASNVYRVEATVDNAGGALRAGLVGRARLVRRTMEDALVVPLDAVVSKKGEHVVFVAEDDGHASRRTVRIAALLGDAAVIDRGLAPGDRVIVEGHRALSDGSPVDVRPAPGPESGGA